MRFSLNLFRPDPVKARAAQLYQAVLTEARKPRLYADLGAPDTVDGRFDMIILHAALVMRRLRDEGESGQKLAQALFGRLFDDMDAALREMGIGDMSVGKKIKAMAEAFYGRAAAYDAALKSADSGQMKAVLWRNLFDDAPDGEPAAEALAGHAFEADRQIQAMPAEELLEGRLTALAAA
ncbi:ubiquinol-cytochrome c chaperone [Glycocaulis albus]|uniref:Ubiquinol-cytochrome c chaperone n=1 Tax=Glycocaulis albus TaxID=1382801 RepID=A0ABQ1XFH0_9PROT|nr:ubiquinol-cytochrome C chaperone family protein [Glycocaulis albus]GGG92950.1 ubiquinol-cytochrome c chaperone [Glycocaulis albus]